MNLLEDTYTDEKARGIGSVAAERWQDTWLVLSGHASQRYLFDLFCNVLQCFFMHTQLSCSAPAA